MNGGDSNVDRLASLGLPIGVGDVLAKKYRVEDLIGEGGTGIVVGARHVQLEQRVAIKFLRKALASEEIRHRFEREVRAIGKIQSEHVVLVLDAGMLDDGSPFMVMEYLEGRDLARVLKEDGPLPVDDAVDCMLQVCEALIEAHANGIVHRDLKPANLFLTRRDEDAPHIKVVDFGISKILDKKLLQDVGAGPREITNAFTVLGSPRYMAPEQLRNSKDVDGRADLWSVGAVLFQLITGKHAFDAETNTQASVRVLTAEPSSLGELVPHAPAGLDVVVRKCLAKDVTHRYQSAFELAEALQPFASERAKESIERLQRAKEAPSLQIALSVSSTSDHPSVVRSSTPPPPSSRPPNAIRRITTSPRAFVPSAPPARPPEPPVVASVRRVYEKSPERSLKIAIALGGLVAVLFGFGALSVAKLAFQSFGGVKPAVKAEPASVAAPDTMSPLDAGRQSP